MTHLSIVESLEGETILLTGATGFLGKVLTEKLLRCCPGLRQIYLLARDKKGISHDKRVKSILSAEFFDKLREEKPNFEDKVTAIEGDCSLPGLGLDLQHKQLLLTEVTLILHGAATVRFDEEFTTAYNINVRGTQQLLLLANEMSKLKGFVHISTAYSNCNLEKIEEKIYDPPIDPGRLERIVGNLDSQLLAPLVPKLLGSWPNTYAFTKAVAERVVYDNYPMISSCIFRPAIVVGTAEGPLIGWTDNLYGPTGVVVGAGCGVLRTLYGDVNCIANIVPVDLTASAIIAASASLLSQREKEKEMKIYNYVSSSQNPLRWKEFKHYIEVHGAGVPPMKAIWCYFLIIHKYWWSHWICVYLLHYFPAVLLDLYNGKKGHSLVEIYRKVDKLSAVLAYFSNRSWEFTDDNVKSLWSRLDPKERGTFNFDIKSLDWETFFYNYIRGLRIYLLKDDLSTLPQAMIRWRRFQIAHNLIQIIFALTIIFSLYFLLSSLFL